MRNADQTVRVAAEWVIKAENDFTTAVHTLRITKRCPTDTICFHAQQCVEKYLKALLVLHAIAFPKIHDLAQLTCLLPHASRPPLSADDQDMLTQYATVTRYPGADNISLTEAKKTVRIARQVRAHIRKAMPKDALCRQ